jgi:ribosomal protein S18 acetylase RimI-like enzyme
MSGATRSNIAVTRQVVTELDYSDPSGDDFEALSRDRIPVRSLVADDLPAIVAIDRRITGRDRTPYYKRKIDEALGESGVRVSLVAETGDWTLGFIMARVDYGEFGQTEPEAVIDTIGVDPAHSHQNVGSALMSQLLANLSTLKVERVRTEVPWDNFALLNFLNRCGFLPSQRLSFSRPII